jgi:hypothetical protein
MRPASNFQKLHLVLSKILVRTAGLENKLLVRLNNDILDDIQTEHIK